MAQSDSQESVPVRGDGTVRVRKKPGSRQTEAADKKPDTPPPELHSPFDEVPPDEPDPRRRDKPTLGVVELTDVGRDLLGVPPPAPAPDYEIPDVAEKNVFRTLEDIMGAFPIGADDGQYFVHVTRTHPSMFMGVATKGILRKIRRKLSLEEFRAEYGGGVYELIVYGPPKRGGIPDEVTGAVRPRACTKPVRITIPYHLHGGHPPSLDVAADEEEEYDMMREHVRNGGSDGQLPFGVPARSATPAAAQIVSHKLKHDETMDEREREERREARRSREHRDASAMELMAQQHQQQTQMLQDTIRELKDDLKRVSSRKPESDLEGVAKVLERVNPRASADELTALREQHQRELERTQAQHRQELSDLNRRLSEDRTRLEEQNRNELRRGEDRISDMQRRADERVRDVEARIDANATAHKAELARQKQELDTQHERELTFVRNESQRNLDALKAQYDTLLSSERRASEREIAVGAQIAESKLATEKRTLEIELTGVKAELRRRDQDVAKLELVVQKNGNLSKLLEEAKKQAELLGWEPASDKEGEQGPTDWKSTLFAVLPKLPELLPQILQSAGGAIAAARGGGAPRELPGRQQQPRQLPPPSLPQPPPPPRRVFATENSEPTSAPPYFDAPVFTPPGMQAPPAAPPPPPMQNVVPQPEFGHMPPGAGVLAEGVSIQQPAMPGLAVAPNMPPAAPVTPSAPPPRPTAPPPAAAAPPSVVPPDPQLDAMILQGRQMILEPAFDESRPPAEVAKFLVGQFGVEQVRQFLPTFGPDLVIGAIQRAGVSSRLTTRRGRKYLTELQQAIIQETQAA